MDELPGNSYKARQKAASPQQPAVTAKEEPPEETKVIAGTVVPRKKPLGKRFAETFFGGQAKDAVNYSIFEVLIPAARSMFLDAVNSALETWVNGSARRSGYNRTTAGGVNKVYTSYNTVSKMAYRPDPRGVRRGRDEHDFSNVVFDMRSDAEAVLERMFDRITKYDRVTVRDFKNLVGETPQYTDRVWGWTSIRDARVQRDRDGMYYIYLPDTEHLPEA